MGGAGVEGQPVCCCTGCGATGVEGTPTLGTSPRLLSSSCKQRVAMWLLRATSGLKAHLLFSFQPFERDHYSWGLCGHLQLGTKLSARITPIQHNWKNVIWQQIPECSGILSFVALQQIETTLQRVACSMTATVMQTLYGVEDRCWIQKRG